jgi:pimeloyl-ACP methyl ester carboxylesterase
VLLLRGEHSDLLLRTVADDMTRNGPKAEIVEIPDCGHAPALLAADQIGVVTDWLARTTGHSVEGSVAKTSGGHKRTDT